MNTTPPPEGAADQQEFIAPDNGGWHWTALRDWIAVCPDISSTAKELYWIIRSVMYEKGDRQRRLSIDQLCWLLPGVKGKPTSSTRVDDALRELKKIGLLSNPDGDVQRRWVTNPTTGKQTRDNFRRWKVHDFPSEGYTGPKSALELLNAYPGPGWREVAKGTETRNSGPQETAKPSPAKTTKDPGHTETRNSGATNRNSGATNRNSGHTEPVTRGNTDSKEAFQGSLSTNQPPPAVDEWAAAEPDRSINGGWLEGGSKDQNPEGPEEDEGDSGSAPQASSELDAVSDTSAGALLLHRVERQNTAHLTGNRTEHIRTINDALAVLSRDVVAHYLGEGLATANTPPGALVGRIRRLPQKVADQQAQQTQRAERGQRGTDQAVSEASTRWQRRETPEELMRALSGDGAFVPSRLRKQAGDAA